MLPWGHMLRLAQRGFGLMPAQFWALSVLEWRLLLLPVQDHADRKSLSALMAQYPDSQKVKADEPQ